MAFGKPPYAQHSPMKIMMLTLKNKPPSTTTFGEKGSKISRSFKNMVDICLKKDAARRPTAKELLKHKFLKKSQGKDYLRTHLFDENKDLKETKTENMKNGDFSDKVNENDKSRKAVSVGNFNFDGFDKELIKDSKKSRFIVEED
ncbi:STE20/SPS1-related proline-alanine-rich protein kinase [Bonamia ostreae]|uniref:STE20/SPS1-related proline-alanine-rich protein kinase n=1 Tax=Bonamia ostreae TaxID=126728 RepID=A0ABV2AU70_9EUKA